MDGKSLSGALQWRQLNEEHETALTELAEACLSADGGLPLLTTPSLLRARLLQDRTLGCWQDGVLIAAISVGVGRTPATGTGLVHPASRGQGLGSHLVSWAEEQAGQADLLMTTESWSSSGEDLLTARGFTRTFLEWVLRHDLHELPDIALPNGILTEPVVRASGPELFTTYRESFADRPGFAEPEAEEWLGGLWDDEGYRPDLSLIARTEDGTPVGFLNIIDDWVDQVGVLPSWRGRRLGAYLVATALRSLSSDGVKDVWLCVNDDNPAAHLYQRLGFQDFGRRARYLRSHSEPQQP